MATANTEHIEGPHATHARAGRSRWRVGWNLFLVLLSGVIWFSAIDHFRHGRYAWGYLTVVLALVPGLNGLGFLIAGRSLEKDYGNFLARHPRFAMIFFTSVIVAIFAWLVCFKHERDQRRAAAYQSRVQAARQVGGMR